MVNNNILQIKRNAVADVAPTNLSKGELAFNETGNKLYIGAEDNRDLVDRGEYSDGVTYNGGDLVTLNGARYILKTFIGAAGYGPITHANSWFVANAADTVADVIAGDGRLLTIETSQIVDAATTFNDVVALSSASTVTQPTSASDPLVANTEFVQNVFSVLDGGNFDAEVIAAGIGKYWYTPTTANNLNKWYNIASWYTDVNHTQPAADLPDANTDVIILGIIRPFADIDRNDWVQPQSIDSGVAGVTFYSLQHGNISIDIVGDATFSGNATYNV